MSTVGSVAMAVGAVAGIVMWFLGRKSAREAKANEPGEQNKRRKEQVAKEVATGDEKGANVSLDDDLRRYRELRVQKPSAVQGDSERPSGDAASPGRQN